jgi:hypothetical protein
MTRKNSIKNFKKNSKKNSIKNSIKNFKKNFKKNSKKNTKKNSRKNFKKNFKKNSKKNFKKNTRKNFKKNTRKSQRGGANLTDALQRLGTQQENMCEDGVIIVQTQERYQCGRHSIANMLQDPTINYRFSLPDTDEAGAERKWIVDNLRHKDRRYVVLPGGEEIDVEYAFAEAIARGKEPEKSDYVTKVTVMNEGQGGLADIIRRPNFVGIIQRIPGDAEGVAAAKELNSVKEHWIAWIFRNDSLYKIDSLGPSVSKHDIGDGIKLITINRKLDGNMKPMCGHWNNTEWVHASVSNKEIERESRCMMAAPPDPIIIVMRSGSTPPAPYLVKAGEPTPIEKNSPLLTEEKTNIITELPYGCRGKKIIIVDNMIDTTNNVALEPYAGIKKPRFTYFNEKGIERVKDSLLKRDYMGGKLKEQYTEANDFFKSVKKAFDSREPPNDTTIIIKTEFEKLVEEDTKAREQIKEQKRINAEHEQFLATYLKEDAAAWAKHEEATGITCGGSK